MNPSDYKYQLNYHDQNGVPQVYFAQTIDAIRVFINVNTPKGYSAWQISYPSSINSRYNESADQGETDD